MDLSSFEKAINRLERSLEYYHSQAAQQDSELALQFMAATIQAFEFTYEICIKFLRRYLAISEPSAEVIVEMSFPNLVRTGSEKGLLLNDWSVWKIYRDKRNITSHTYDEKKASDVMQAIPGFLHDARYLLHALQQRIKSL